MTKISSKPSIRNCRLLRLLFIVVLLLSFIKVILSNTLATDGAISHQISEKTSTTIEENQRLRGEIAQLGSISRVSREAKGYGFTNNSIVVNISTEIPIALR